MPQEKESIRRWKVTPSLVTLGSFFFPMTNIWEYCVDSGDDRVGTVIDREGAGIATFLPELCARCPSKVHMSLYF